MPLTSIRAKTRGDPEEVGRPLAELRRSMTEILGVAHESVTGGDAGAAAPDPGIDRDGAPNPPPKAS